MAVQVFAPLLPELSPLSMPDRFRHEVTYFMSLPEQAGRPRLPDNQYWVPLENARQWLETGCFRLVSPLDGENQTEIELSEEQETWLEWMVEHQVDQIELR